MKTLREQRDEIVARGKAIVDAIRFEKREATDDESAALKKCAEELAEVDEKIKRADESEKTMSMFATAQNSVGTGAPVGGSKSDDGDDPKTQASSLGEFFVKSGGLEALQKRAGGASQFSVGVKDEYLGPTRVKAPTDTQVAGTTYAGPTTSGLLVPGYDLNVEMAPRVQPTIADLLGSGTVENTSLTYFVQGAKEGSPAPTLELGRKPQVHYNWTSRTDTLKKIAGVTKLSDEAMQDIKYLVSEIDGQLLYDLKMAEENALLNGTGTDPEIQGLLNRSGVQVVTAVAADAAQDVIFRAMTSIQTATQIAPDGIVIHPTTYQKLRLKRDGNGQYFGGGFFEGQYGGGAMAWQPPLWGLRTIVTPAVAVDQVVVGAFRAAGTVYRKGGVRLESTNSNEDDFEFNRITIRVEERLMLQVRKPMAIAKVNIAAAAAA